MKKPSAVSTKISPNILTKHAPITHDRGQIPSVVLWTQCVYVGETFAKIMKSII